MTYETGGSAGLNILDFPIGCWGTRRVRSRTEGDPALCATRNRRPGHAGSKLLRLILILTLLGWVSDSDAAPPSLEDYLSLGRYFLERNAPGRAISEFESAVQLAPERPEAHYNLGLALRVWGDLSGAEAALRKALELQPRFPEAHFALGLVLGDRVGSEHLGLAEFEAAVAQDLSYAEAHFNIGIIRWKANEVQLAERSFRRAVAASPESSEFHSRLGQALAKLDRPSDAIRALGRAIDLDPSHVQAHYQLAFVLSRLGKKKRAAKHIEIVGKLKKAGSSAVQKDQSYLAYRQGMAALEQGRTQAAIDNLTRAVRGAANGSQVRNGLGIAYQRKGDYRAALVEFRRAIQLDPESVDGHLNYGTLLLRSGDAAGAEREFRSCLQLDPNFADGHYNLGLLLASRQRWAEAMASLRRAIRLRPGHARARWNLARVLRDSGETSAALKQYQQACQLDQSLVEANLEYGRLLAAEGRTSEAVNVWKAALKRNPTHERLHESLVSALEREGDRHAADQRRRKFQLLTQSADYREGVRSLNERRFEESIGHFRNVLQIHPELDEVRRSLALALFANRDYRQAVAEYRRLVNDTREDTDLRLSLAIALLRASSPEEAKLELNQVVNLNPKSAQAFYQLGMIYLAERDRARATEHFHRTRRIDPTIKLPE